MSAYSFILPVLSVICFLWFIIASQRAWLPKPGTTEWIRRSAFPPKFTADGFSHLCRWHYLSAVGIAVIYGAVVSVCFSDISDSAFQPLLRCVCAGVFAGAVFLTGCTLFSGFGAGIIAAAVSAADIWLYDFAGSGDICTCIGLALAMLYVLSICSAVKHPFLLIISGLLLGGAVYCNFAFVIFAVFGLCTSFCAGGISGNKRFFWMFPVFSVILPGIIFCAASFFTRNSLIPQLSAALPKGVFDPVYLAISVICLIIAFIHIFRDKSFAALVIVFCAACSIGCGVFGVPCAALFSGLALAYSGNIIMHRGTACRKAAAIILPIVLFLGIVVSVCLNVDISEQYIRDILSSLSICRIHLN